MAKAKRCPDVDVERYETMPGVWYYMLGDTVVQIAGKKCVAIE